MFNNEYISLRNTDLRNPDKISIHCKIRKVKEPRIAPGKRYIQELELFDDDTNKTIYGLLSNAVANFDKWNNKDEVLLTGYYNQDYEIIKDFHNLAWLGKELPERYIYIIQMEHASAPEDILQSYDSRIQKFPEYNQWRQKILNKDHHKCVVCGYDKLKRLQVHHLYGYEEHPELAIDEGNGVTLCQFCHDKYHSLYGLKNINPRDFMEFINHFGSG